MESAINVMSRQEIGTRIFLSLIEWQTITQTGFTFVEKSTVVAYYKTVYCGISYVFYFHFVLKEWNGFLRPIKTFLLAFLW